VETAKAAKMRRGKGKWQSGNTDVEPTVTPSEFDESRNLSGLPADYADVKTAKAAKNAKRDVIPTGAKRSGGIGIRRFRRLRRYNH